MTNINTFKEISENIKDLISPYHDGKIFNKQVAAILQIDEINFANMIKRNSIPYQSILDFCCRIDEDPRKIFYKSHTKVNI